MQQTIHGFLLGTPNAGLCDFTEAGCRAILSKQVVDLPLMLALVGRCAFARPSFDQILFPGSPALPGSFLI
jgi:hypothetical protein